MKRYVIVLATVVAVAGFTFAVAHAADKAEMKGMKEMKPTTMTGEIVDLGCYLGHGARGEKHAECATKCIAGGMPMGLLTAKGGLYLLTMDHANADPFNHAKDWAAKQVKVTGQESERDGMKSLEVSSAELVADASAPAK
ncbi:MAG: hypothetical protein ACM3JJ_01245 [Hyphomicrobiales bacterium]